MKNINVFTNFYSSPSKDRNLELENCLFRNCKDKNINLIAIESENRLEFNDFFKAIENYGDNNGINIICNSDIYFDDSILLTKKMSQNHVYALNRWDVIPSGVSVHYRMLGSADVWVFNGIPKNIKGNQGLGIWGCDGRIGYEIVKAGYELFNPSNSIKTLHYHISNIRNYTYKNIISGPYMGALPCSLEELIPAKEFNAKPPRTLLNKVPNKKKYNFIYFYNNWHNGDLHVSRDVVKKIISQVEEKDVSFYYGHNCDPNILADIPAVYDNRYSNLLKTNVDTSYFEKDGGIFINTWYGVEKFKYYNQLDPTFDCIYEVLLEPAKQVGVDLEQFNLVDLFPNIGFNKYNVEKINLSFMDGKINVLISNGMVYSAQTKNYNMNGLIKKLSDGFCDVNFIITNVDSVKVNAPNVFYTKDLINIAGCDLNENAYIGTKCQIIVGRCSGAYTFSLNRQNLFDRDCTLLCFCDYPEHLDDFWVGKKFSGKIKFRSKSHNYKTQDINFIYGKISETIKSVK